MYKLGIDVGGTNTDAVLIDEHLKVIAEVKYPTSGNIFEGIMGAVQKLLKQTQVDRSQIRQAMLGTTQCTNAIVERKNLARIGLLRIGAPATLGVPPMADWADDIRFICEKSAVIGGGFEYDGKQLAPLDEEAARAFFASLVGRVESVAISCVFSPVRNDHELRAAEICREVMGPDVHISISSEIGSMGLVERENATILNAALYKVAERFTEGFAYSLAQEGVTNADVYLSQNDGTLMTMDYARRYPILTVGLRPHQLHPRRQLPQPPGQRHRHRRGRHHHRPGRDSKRLPPRIRRGCHHRRRAHQLPHARRVFHRPGRRLHRARARRRLCDRRPRQRGL